MKILCVIFFLGLVISTSGQDSLNKYGLYVINDLQVLEQTIQKDSNKAFVRIKDYVPGIVLDIKYATTQNVFYQKFYDKPHAFARLPVVKALAKAQEEFRQHSVGIKIYDSYRPYSVTCSMWDLMPDSIYMGKPWRGSKHNRGVALDLTLVDIKTGQELRMPTPYDALVYPSHPSFMQLPDSIIRNRQLLISILSKHGFTVASNEWWHWDYADAFKYELLDIPPNEIEKMIRKNNKRKTL